MSNRYIDVSSTKRVCLLPINFPQGSKRPLPLTPLRDIVIPFPGLSPPSLYSDDANFLPAERCIIYVANTIGLSLLIYTIFPIKNLFIPKSSRKRHQSIRTDSLHHYYCAIATNNYSSKTNTPTRQQTWQQRAAYPPEHFVWQCRYLRG